MTSCHPHAYSRKPESGLWTLHRERATVRVRVTPRTLVNRKVVCGTLHRVRDCTVHSLASRKVVCGPASDSDDIHLPTICNRCYARMSRLSASRGKKHYTPAGGIVTSWSPHTD